MSEELRDGQILDQVLSKYSALMLQQNAAVNEKVDRLIDVTASTSEKLGSLAEIIARSEERHNTHAERNIRLEKVQIEQGKEFKAYKSDNDKRMNAVEKQVLLLDVNDKLALSRFSATDKRNAAIFTAVLIAGTLTFLGLK